MDTSGFYSSQSSFCDFEGFTDSNNYQTVPGDWSVYVTDVVNSTRAIEAGKYKEVNLIGAAGITLCINLLKGREFPFVFGGDGASFCIHANDCPAVDAELGSLMRLALDNYGLELRVARIPVRELEQRGKQVQVARFELYAGKSLAFFRGGGLDEAERLAKLDGGGFRVPVASVAVEELAGLSCRWSPITTRKGSIVSLLAKARVGTHGPQVYARLMTGFRQVLASSLDAANPVAVEKVRYKSFLSALKEEWRFHRSIFSMAFCKRVIELVLAIIIFRHGINVAKGSFDSGHYVQHMRYHSDYRKFDDTLRLVLDCSEEQAAGLEAVLEAARAEGLIHYGLHRSDAALMTCFVQTMQDGGHLHFIDGGNGGFARAAQQLKQQLRQAEPRPADE